MSKNMILVWIDANHKHFDNWRLPIGITRSSPIKNMRPFAFRWIF